MILARGAYPSPLGYSSFPRSCTTSVNNVIAREWHLLPIVTSTRLTQRPKDGIPDESA